MKKTPLATKLSWDSNFFRINIARLNRTRVTKKDMTAVIKFCQKAKIKCLYFTADSNDPVSVRLAEQHGFHFVNIRVKYTFDSRRDSFSIPARLHRFIFRPAKKPDLPELLAMSRNLFRDTRYYFDKNFSDEIGDRFYSLWIRKLAAAKKKAEGVYVLADKRKIAGYIGYGVDDNIVHLFLVGVNIRFQGHGVGRAMLREFLQEMLSQGYHRFETVTQGRNIASQRLYQAAGFKITSSEIDYHKWF